MKPDMEHTPAAPQERACGTLAGDMPPMAYTGICTLSHMSLRYSGPFPGVPSLQAVSYTCPARMYAAPLDCAYNASSVLWQDTPKPLNCCSISGGVSFNFGTDTCTYSAPSALASGMYLCSMHGMPYCLHICSALPARELYSSGERSLSRRITASARLLAISSTRCRKASSSSSPFPFTYPGQESLSVTHMSL